MSGGEEIAAGPAAPKVARLVYFVAAGFICTAGINKWRDIKRKSAHQQLPDKQSNVAQKAVE